jgi:hypothetical protein
MNKNLKQILLKIAQLPQTDQCWINKHLSLKQQEIFNKLKGEKLLQKARRFSKLRTQNLNSSFTIPLPNYCQHLANQPPLYVAIVLQQGNYHWQESFLQSFDSQGLISHLLKTELGDIKSSTKKMLFKHWENSLSFDSFLGNTND